MCFSKSEKPDLCRRGFHTYEAEALIARIVALFADIADRHWCCLIMEEPVISPQVHQIHNSCIEPASFDLD